MTGGIRLRPSRGVAKQEHRLSGRGVSHLRLEKRSHDREGRSVAAEDERGESALSGLERAVVSETCVRRGHLRLDTYMRTPACGSPWRGRGEEATGLITRRIPRSDSNRETMGPVLYNSESGSDPLQGTSRELRQSMSHSLPKSKPRAALRNPPSSFTDIWVSKGDGRARVPPPQEDCNHSHYVRQRQEELERQINAHRL